MENSFMNAAVLFRELLSKESDALSELVRQEEEKFDAIKLVDIHKLMRINSREEDVLHRLDSVEKKRKEALIALSKITGMDINVSLSELIDQLPEDSGTLKDDFRSMRLTIKALTEKLQITMRENSEMIKTNLDIINLTLNFANRTSQKDTYNFRNKRENRENIFLVNQLA